MKKLLTVMMLLLAAGMMAAENLLPPIEVALDNNENLWHSARNAACVAEFSADVEKGVLRIATSTETGYANYRRFLALAPGEYTADIQADGKAEKPVIGLEIYSFDAAGKAQPICLKFFPEGLLKGARMAVNFSVPAGSVKQRLALCVNGRGTVEFIRPAVYKGKIALGDLPAREGLSASGKALAPAAKGWKADWVWVKDCDKIAKASFIKELELKSPVSAALVQVTADNGYALKVNDSLVGVDGDWKTIEKYDIAGLLKPGKNTIELIGENYDGVGGVILQGQVWMEDGSALEFATGPDWALYIDGKPREEQKVILGKVPVVPWSNITFHPMMPPDVVRLPAVRYINSVKPGEVFVLELDGGDALPSKELSELAFSFFDAAGRRAALSAYPRPQVRLQGKRLYVELVISPYAQVGAYSWKLEGLTTALAPAEGAQTITVEPGTVPPGQPGTKFPKLDGTDKMMTPAGEQALFTYSTTTPTIQHFFNWRHTGGHMYEVMVPAGTQTPDGQVDLSAVEQEMMQILAADPDAGIYAKIRVDVPGWWGSRNPDETFKSDKGRGALQSFCSEVWAQDTEKLLKTVVDALAARPVGKALSGVLVMGFRGGEFQLWGEDVGEYDCSAPARRAFAAWQKANGVADPVDLPHPALSWPFQDKPGYARVRADFFRFVAERHADNLIRFARFFKKTYGDKYDFGLYFGYAMEHGGSWMRMLYGGHLGFGRVLAEAPLNLISCPASYSLRRSYQSHAFMNTPSSAALHGIRSMFENDVRNYAYPLVGDSSGTTIYSMRDSLVNDSRQMLFAACHGAVVRYLALAEGMDWFALPQSIEQIARDNARNQKLLPAELGMSGQLVLAIDPLSWVRAADSGFTEPKWGEFVSNVRDTVMRSGRSVAFCVLDDVLANPGKWKNAVIPAPALLDQDKRARVEQLFGPFPALKPDTGALVIVDGKITTADSREELWRAIATPEALAAGIDTVWYVGKNFVGTWDGKNLKWTIDR